MKPWAGQQPNIRPSLMGSKGFPEEWIMLAMARLILPIWEFINVGLASKADNKLIKTGREALKIMLPSE